MTIEMNIITQFKQYNKRHTHNKLNSTEALKLHLKTLQFNSVKHCILLALKLTTMHYLCIFILATVCAKTS